MKLDNNLIKMSNLITPDYYETLELSRAATQEDISEAYRNLSIRFHPSKATEALRAVYEYKFHKIAEAYTILSDPNKKGIYDIYGKKGLNEGIRDKKTGTIKGAYKYTGNAYEIFETYMTTTNPYGLIQDKDRMDDAFGSIFASAYGGSNKQEEKPLPDIEMELECTLEEMYNGTIKEIEYEANRFNTDKRTTSFVKLKVNVEIFPGYHKETVLTYPQMGNEAPGMKSSNLIVKIKEKKHDTFKRVNKNDLVYVNTIKLVEALNSVPIEITTLDGRKLSIPMDEIVTPSTLKIVKGEGMPVYDKENNLEEYLLHNKKGDLYIRFNIIFPDYINGKKKERIIALLTE